jgi:hypothetical protein
MGIASPSADDSELLSGAKSGRGFEILDSRFKNSPFKNLIELTIKPSFPRSAWECPVATLRVAWAAERPRSRSHAGAWERDHIEKLAIKFMNFSNS